MVVLSQPQAAGPAREWRTIASEFNCFCVQEFIDAAAIRTQRLTHRLLTSNHASIEAGGNLSQSPSSSPSSTVNRDTSGTTTETNDAFRVIYSIDPTDFSAAEGSSEGTERTDSSGSSSSNSKSGDGGKSATSKSILATAPTLSEILADWGRILAAWADVKHITAPSASPISTKSSGQLSASAGTTNPTARSSASLPRMQCALTRKEWDPVYEHIQRARSSTAQGAAAAGGSDGSSGGGGGGGKKKNVQLNAQLLASGNPAAMAPAAATAAVADSQTTSFFHRRQLSASLPPRSAAPASLTGPAPAISPFTSSSLQPGNSNIQGDRARGWVGNRSSSHTIASAGTVAHSSASPPARPASQQCDMLYYSSASVQPQWHFASPRLDVYEVLTLRLYDLLTWRDPQQTLCLLLFYWLGGRLCYQSTAWLQGWMVVVVATLAMAAPLTAAQLHRYGGEGEGDADEAKLWAVQRLCGKWLLRPLWGRGKRVSATTAGKIAGGGSTTGSFAIRGGSGAAETEAGETQSLLSLLLSFCQTRLFALGVCPFLLNAILALLFPPNVLNDANGAFHLTATMGHLIGVWLAPALALAVIALGVRAVLASEQTRLSAMLGFADRTHTLVVMAVRQQLWQLAHPHLHDEHYRYTSPSLTEAEIRLEEHLTNYGAPFASTLVQPLRLWNSATEAWGKKWVRDGLTCEALYSPSGNTIIGARYTINVPNANIGTLQAILLDGSSMQGGGSELSTLAFQWNPSVRQRTVLRHLDHNLRIVRTRLSTLEWGCEPVEAIQFECPAEVLTAEQQAALRIRFPAAATAGVVSQGSRSGTGGDMMRPSSLRVMVQAAVPLPEELDSAHVTGVQGSLTSAAAEDTEGAMYTLDEGITHRKEEDREDNDFVTYERVKLTSCIIGIEEEDGSLTLGFVFTTPDIDKICGPQWTDVMLVEKGNKVRTIAGWLREFGPQQDTVAVYRNEKGFQPLLEREDRTNKPSSKPQTKKVQSVSAAAAITTEESEEESKSPVAKTLKRGPSMLRDAQTPSICRRFIADLLARRSWKREVVENLNPARSLRNVRLFTASVEGSKAKVLKMELFVPHATLSVAVAAVQTEAFLPLAGSTVGYSTAVGAVHAVEVMVKGQSRREQRAVMESQSIAAELENSEAAEDAAVLVSASSVANRAFALIAKERRGGHTLRHTIYTAPSLTMKPRDTLLRATPGLCLTAKDAVQLLLTQEELSQVPALKDLPEESLVYIRCAEDASDVLPTLPHFSRVRMPLCGLICWEVPSGASDWASEGEESEAGVVITICVASDPDGWSHARWVDKAMKEQLQGCEQLLHKIQVYMDERGRGRGAQNASA